MAAGTGSERPPRRRDPIKIVPYDARWPAAFAHEQTRIEAALGQRLVGRVEHIGSTSIPGLAAKPIIDMLALLEDYDRSARVVAELGAIGWVHAPEPGDREQRKWSFCFPDIAWRTHHLHIWENASPHWRHLLLFRDHLRRHPDLVTEYARIKTDLAAADQHDRPRYRSGKAPFIQDIVRQLDVPTEPCST
ncbi:GrpB family protein [Micromonosporaceae bacterium B7E4]